MCSSRHISQAQVGRNPTDASSLNIHLHAQICPPCCCTQVAALVLATYTTLLPFLRNERQVLQIIQAHMGGRTSPFLRCLFCVFVCVLSLFVISGRGLHLVCGSGVVGSSALGL
jgi:hypothetical protein